MVRTAHPTKTKQNLRRAETATAVCARKTHGGSLHSFLCPHNLLCYILRIIATLLHDVLEERLDEWTEQMINRELTDPAYGEYCRKQMKEVPVSLRHKIIQKHIDAYNDRASGIFFSIG